MSETYHLISLTEAEAMGVCQAISDDFNTMVFARVSADIDAKAKSEGIAAHARWAFPVMESLKRIRGGLYQWPSGWFQYMRRVAEEHSAPDALKAKLARAGEYAYTADEIQGAKIEMAAERRSRKGNK